jgi:diguanylate cyclase (GGDEF)-like protein
MLANLIAEEIAAVQSSSENLVVCNLRLERLFEMGNVLGQAGVDNLVRAVAVRLGDVLNGHQLLARTRRDEFVMVYRAQQSEFSAEFLKQFIADRQFSVEEQGNIFLIEFTVGLALYPVHASDAQSLLAKAEQAMLQARKNGQQWTAYDEQQQQQFVRHHTLFGKLREALLLQHLHVYYQPQLDLASGRVLGAEALMRWIDPVEGMIPPVSFIPVAEESGLIRPLTTWLVGECMRECARWSQQGLHLDVSINLSARNLMDPDLLGVFERALEQAQVSPSRVNMEITESCFMGSPERAMEVIQKIHERGFKLSIDDFGTGYSSLAYLKNLPIDELKIDQSFVRKLLDNPGDQAIVSSTIDLAHNFKLSVVAEGIEDEPTANWLRERGCDVAQGYFYARPMPADDFLAFAKARV